MWGCSMLHKDYFISITKPLTCFFPIYQLAAGNNFTPASPGHPRRWEEEHQCRGGGGWRSGGGEGWRQDPRWPEDHLCSRLQGDFPLWFLAKESWLTRTLCSKYIAAEVASHLMGNTGYWQIWFIWAVDYFLFLKKQIISIQEFFFGFNPTQMLRLVLFKANNIWHFPQHCPIFSV